MLIFSQLACWEVLRFEINRYWPVSFFCAQEEGESKDECEIEETQQEIENRKSFKAGKYTVLKIDSFKDNKENNITFNSLYNQ